MPAHYGKKPKMKKGKKPKGKRGRYLPDSAWKALSPAEKAATATTACPSNLQVQAAARQTWRSPSSLCRSRSTANLSCASEGHVAQGL